MCQYVVQRIMKALTAKVVDDYTSIDNAMPVNYRVQQSGGDDTLDQMTGRAKQSSGNRVFLVDGR